MLSPEPTQLRIDRLAVEGSGVEVLAEPFAPMLVFRVRGVGDGVAQYLVAPDAAAVFRWPGEFASGAGGVRAGRLVGGWLLDQDHMPPAIAEIVLVDEAQPDRRRDLGERDLLLIEIAQLTSPMVNWWR